MAKFVTKMTAIAQEMRMRGFWGSLQAAKGHKLGMAKFQVGEDEVGNKYFENPSLPLGRDRWVEYADYFTKRGIDSMKVPGEWHMWLHRMVDDMPTKTASQAPKYVTKVEGNKSGTKDAHFSPHNPMSRNYVGHAPQRTESWDPKKATSTVSPQQRDVLDLK